ncbi:hypothetical protein AB1N83_011108 [Pleurotus pulmonarius]
MARFSGILVRSPLVRECPNSSLAYIAIAGECGSEEDTRNEAVIHVECMLGPQRFIEVTLSSLKEHPTLTISAATLMRPCLRSSLLGRSPKKPGLGYPLGLLSRRLRRLCVRKCPLVTSMRSWLTAIAILAVCHITGLTLGPSLACCPVPIRSQN